MFHGHKRGVAREEGTVGNWERNGRKHTYRNGTETFSCSRFPDFFPAPPASCTKKSSTIGNRKLENFSLYLFWLHWLDSTPPVLRYTHTPTYIWAYPAYIDNQLPLSCAVLLSKVFLDRRVLSSNRKLSDGKNFNGAASKPRDWNFNCKTGSFQFAGSCHLGNSPPRSLKLSEMPPKNWHKVRCN